MNRGMLMTRYGRGASASTPRGRQRGWGGGVQGLFLFADHSFRRVPGMNQGAMERKIVRVLRMGTFEMPSPLLAGLRGDVRMNEGESHAVGGPCDAASSFTCAGLTLV